MTIRFELLRFWLLPPFLGFNRSAESTRWDSFVRISFDVLFPSLFVGILEFLFFSQGEIELQMWKVEFFFFSVFASMASGKGEIFELFEVRISVVLQKLTWFWNQEFSLLLIECSRFGRSSFYGALARLCWSSCNSSTWRRASFLLPAGAYRTGNSTQFFAWFMLSCVSVFLTWFWLCC